MPPDPSQIRKDMIATFETEQGKKVFAWLLRRCGFDSTINVFDPYEVMFHEGRRSVVVDMLNEMTDTRLRDREQILANIEAPHYEVTEVGDAV